MTCTSPLLSCWLVLIASVSLITSPAEFPNPGSVDPAFLVGSGPSYRVHDIKILEDGKILICGDFRTVSGVSRNQIANLNADGTLNSTFDHVPNLGFSFIETMELQPDGGVLAGGDMFPGIPTAFAGLIRFKPDGEVDASFQPPFKTYYSRPAQVISLKAQPDGKILVSCFAVHQSVQNAPEEELVGEVLSD